MESRVEFVVFRFEREAISIVARSPGLLGRQNDEFGLKSLGPSITFNLETVNICYVNSLM